MPHDPITQMSARLDNLVEFTLNEKDAKLAEALIKHGMEGHAKRMGLISSDYVSAPSAQAKVQEAIKKMKRPTSWYPGRSDDSRSI